MSDIKHANNCDRGDGFGCLCETHAILAMFPTVEDARKAKALVEAVDLCGPRGEIRWDRPAPPFKAWRITRFYQHPNTPLVAVDGDTLPAAIAALREKVEG